MRKKIKNNSIQIITYPDSLGGDLGSLKKVLDKHFKNHIDGVHILPFYPSSGDRGFAPLTHRRIDPVFGTDDDLLSIASDYNLMADLIVNHVSVRSKYFQDYLKKGDESKYKNYFIKSSHFARRFYKEPNNNFFRFIFLSIGQIATFLRGIDFIFHKHGVNKLILRKIYRPRPGSPFVRFMRDDGKKEYIWCTFSPEQVDLNIDSKGVRKKFMRDVRHLKKLGVKYLRLDAVAYAGKMRGTNSFLIPKAIHFLEWLSDYCKKNKIKVIPEVHFDYKTQIFLSNFKNIDYVYDFSLPFLILHAIHLKNPHYLREWLKVRPYNSISNLDTHDGIGVVDVKGQLPEEEIKKTSDIIYGLGGNAAKRASGKNSKNLDIYQINSTYYSALKEDDNLYLMARAIQLFLPGIVQIYYVGFLAGKNDMDLLNKTKNGRDINRHSYDLKEVDKEIKRPVVKKLLRLCELRKNHQAFSGKYFLKDTDNDIIEIEWIKKDVSLKLKVDFRNMTFEIKENNIKVEL